MGALVLCLVAVSAQAATLEVGEGKPFATPSAAIGHAQDGDTILIAPGTYFDCAIVAQNRLTLAGSGPGAVMTDKTCEGKALLVLRGNDVTIRDLHLARARVPDGNGAGIRLEAPNLTLERVAFDNDQVGLLSGASGGTIRIEDCSFTDGGVGGDQPLFAIMAGQAAVLSVHNSRFSNVAGGQIETAADRSEITGNTIATGSGDLPGPAIEATAGQLQITDNTFVVGPNSPRRGAAVSLWDAAGGTLQHNTLENRTGQSIALLLDWSWSSPTLNSNTIGQNDRESTSHGLLRHRVSTFLRSAKAALHRLAHNVKEMVHWLI